MSLVVFPFKNEALDVVGTNLKLAASHDRVVEVWAVAAQEGQTMDRVANVAADVSGSENVPIQVFPQDRIGSFRAGKGDGMNTAIRNAAERGFDRVHFYDADITNFDHDWIDGAEQAADRGFAVVRHRFPRASTDAMVTWMITRPGLAKLFPHTVLPRLGQPLGGELLLTGPVIEDLSTDTLVTERSDWGVDTVITYATASMGLPVFEHNVAAGKRHTLYGSLDEIKDMVIECLDAVRSLAGLQPPRPETVFEADPPESVPEGLKQTVGYDIETTRRLLTEGWTDAELELTTLLPDEIEADFARNRTTPVFDFMDETAWSKILDMLLRDFALDDKTWSEFAFRLWLTRVLSYTTTHTVNGYDSAMTYLESTILAYEVAR